MSFCPTHGSYQDNSAGYCPKCGSHARLIERPFTVLPTRREVTVTEAMVRAAFFVMYPGTAWNPYQDSATHELIRRMIVAALEAQRG